MRTRVLVHRAALAAGLVLAVACANAPPPRVVSPTAPVAAPDRAAPTPAAEPAWERIREVDGIVVDRREVAGSPLIAFRGEGVVAAPLLRVAAVLVDVSRSPEWVDSVIEARELRRIDATTSVNYSHVKTPPLVSDRDFVLRGTLEVSPGRIVIRIKSVEDDAMPPGRFVRGEVHDSSFVLQRESDGATRVTAEIHADPKGALPTWLVNVFQRSWAVKTIRALRTQVRKPDVVDPAWLAELVARGGLAVGRGKALGTRSSCSGPCGAIGRRPGSLDPRAPVPVPSSPCAVPRTPPPHEPAHGTEHEHGLRAPTFAGARNLARLQIGA